MPNKPVFFYNTIGPEELSGTGTSFLNRTEAINVEKIISKILKCPIIEPDEIGVITPYEGQKSFLKSYMLSYGSMPHDVYERIEISSVDSF